MKEINMKEINIKELTPYEGIKKIIAYIKLQKEYTEIITNLQIGSALADSEDSEEYIRSVKQPGLCSPNKGPYKVFDIDNFEVFIDPYMAWGDTRLIFSNKNHEHDEVKIIHADNLI